jgi:hypothetical protein
MVQVEETVELEVLEVLGVLEERVVTVVLLTQEDLLHITREQLKLVLTQQEV